MIPNKDGSFVVSSFGWVENGAVWTYSSKSREVATIPLSTARWVELLAGVDDMFAALHHWDGEDLELSVASISAPGDALAQARLSGTDQKLTGELSVWEHVPKAYTAWYAPSGANGGSYCLIRPDVSSKRLKVTPLSWFDDSYDWEHQGVTGVTEVPDSDLLLFTVGRDRHLVLYDPGTDQVVRRIRVGGSNGADAPRFHRGELWVKDYDHLVRVDPKDWSVTRSLRLQGDVRSPYGPTGSFIGEFGFVHDGDECFVARPESNDVLLLDCDSMTVTRRARFDGQPLEATVLSDGTVVARDWKTGRLLVGEMAKPGRRFRLP